MLLEDHGSDHPLKTSISKYMPIGLMANPTIHSHLGDDDLIHACQRTLDAWPEARAAVLFGSRARGTNRTDSDWDIVIVLDNKELTKAYPVGSDTPQVAALTSLRHVDTWVVGEDDLKARATTLGTLPYAVCRDGRLIAGHWKQPDFSELHKDYKMKPQDWQRRMEQVLTQMNISMLSIREIAIAEEWEWSHAFCNDLLRTSSNSAELLVKAVLERRGVAADRTHDIAILASTFRNTKPEFLELAEQLAALNGDSRRDHLALYDMGEITVPMALKAITRLDRTLNLWTAEVTIDPSDLEFSDKMIPQANELARRAIHTCLDSWQNLLQIPVTPKTDLDSGMKVVGEAILASRSELIKSVNLLGTSLTKLMNNAN